MNTCWHDTGSDTKSKTYDEEKKFDSQISSHAFHGFVGEIMSKIEPHTESDIVAILINFLTFMGNIIGPNPYFMAQSKKNYGKIFSVIVGQSAKSRKGSSLGPLFQIFNEVDPNWSEKRIKSGLSSGEGLIGDIAVQLEQDQGDLRLLVIEEEFGNLLKVARRIGNTITVQIRKSWDGEGGLSTLTKKPLSVSKSHISILGQITQDELKMSIDDVDVHNGFLNRFIWLYVERSKFLPEGGNFHNEDLTDIIEKIKECIEFSKNIGEIKRDGEAKIYWEKLYYELSGEVPGVFGAITSRGENQVMRMAMIYAILDKSKEIKVVHLKAAEAVWRYSQQSVKYLFENKYSRLNTDTLKLKRALIESNSLTLTEVSKVFNNNKTKSELSSIIDILLTEGMIETKKINNNDGRKPTSLIKLIDT